MPLTPDHVVPLARGGNNLIGNIQPLCGRCNTIKGDRVRIDYRISPDVLERYPNKATHGPLTSIGIWRSPTDKATAQAFADERDVSMNKWVQEAIVEKIARDLAS